MSKYSMNFHLYYINTDIQSLYENIAQMVPRGAEAWYRTYRPDGTGTKVPIYTLSKSAVRTVPHGTLR